MLRVFPVDASGKPYFSQAFSDAHRGTDVFAKEGTPVLAVDDGRLEHGDDPRGGIVAMLHASDGTRYYYAHLQGYEGDPRTVKAGEPIGRVGRTGNAATKPAHLHFEIHPLEGHGPESAIDPFPALQATAPGGAALVPVPSAAKPAKAGGGALLLVLGLYLWSRHGRS